MDGRNLTPLASLAAPLTGLSLMLATLPAPAWAPEPTPGARPPKVQVAAAPAPAPRPARRATAAEMRCLALNVYWEARGQPLSGQAAVAHVTLNRTEAPGFPATICGVVHQGCQFGWTCDRRSNSRLDPAAWDEAQAVARRALAGEVDPSRGALYFHAISEHPAWVRGHYGHRVVIGQHVFFNTRDHEQQVAEAPAK